MNSLTLYQLDLASAYREATLAAKRLDLALRPLEACIMAPKLESPLSAEKANGTSSFDDPGLTCWRCLGSGLETVPGPGERGSGEFDLEIPCRECSRD